MTDSKTPTATTDPIRVAPVFQLSRLGLCISLFLMVSAGLFVYALFPESVGGPPLPVEVGLGQEPVETADGSGALMTEVILFQNLTDHAIPKFSIEINGQYLLFRDAPLEAQETLVLPQRVFTDKRSSHRYNPVKYPVKTVKVTGQLPTGARGVTQFVFEDGEVIGTH